MSKKSQPEIVNDVPCGVGTGKFQEGCPKGCSCTHIGQVTNRIFKKNF